MQDLLSELQKTALKLKIRDLMDMAEEFSQADILLQTVLIVRLAGMSHESDCVCPCASEMLRQVAESFSKSLYANVRDNCLRNNVLFEDDPNQALRDEIKAEIKGNE